MQSIVKHEPAFSLLQVQLAPGEVLTAEAGAMVARSSNLTMEVKLNADPSAGFFTKVKAICVAFVRKLVGGESFFVNQFSSPQGGWVWLAPAMSGSIRQYSLQGRTMLFSSGAYLASAGPVTLRMRFGGLRALFAKAGAFFIEASGQGDIFVNSYGGIDEVHCNGTYVVDNGHLVGFDSTLDFKISSAGGGLMGLLASGEGLVCEFRGQGRILLQSRNTGSLVGWLTRLLP